MQSATQQFIIKFSTFLAAVCFHLLSCFIISLLLQSCHSFQSIPSLFNVRQQWQMQGGQSGHGPPSKLAMEFGPLSREEKIMTVLRICRNVRILAPLSMLVTD